MMKLLMEESGQGMAEYALILAGIALAVLTAFGLMGEAIQGFFERFTAIVNNGG